MLPGFRGGRWPGPPRRASRQMEIGQVRQVDIDEQMGGAYLDYAMSVIVARALPDARDGLKPVHRRILYAMHDMGMRSNGAYRKSARIVGEVLGKYHPHGDQAVYDAMARMAQDFAMRYMLVDGQGNFGSIDGDSPAAMRYTEARLARMAEELLVDIDKETVDFGDNFDGSLKEPLILPSRLPNLLLNGSTGIAVGMATNIPPHNLGELTNALRHLIDAYDRFDDVTVDELMAHLPGPDFPTGGVIVGVEGVKQAYSTGKGRLVVRAQARKVLNQLFKYPPLQTSFGIQLLALVDGEPRLLSLKRALQFYVEHRRMGITRRSEFELAKARARAHVLDGLLIALTHLDEVIQTIRKSPDADIAKERLVKQFALSEIQAQAILDMQLRRLAALERKKIEDEHKEILKQIAHLEDLLAHPKKILGVIKDDPAA